MGMFVYFAVPMICALLFRTILRQPTGTLFLEGLNAFLPQKSAIAPPPGPKASKRERKMMQKRQVQLKGAQSTVVIQQLTTSALGHLGSEPSTFATNFESLGTLLLVLFVGVVVHFALGPLFGLWQDVLLYSLGPVVVLWSAVQLVLLECNGSLGRLLGGDRTRVLLVGMVAGAAAFVVLMGLPPGWIRWDAFAATKQLDALFNGGMARLVAARMRQMQVQPPPPLRSQPHQVAGGLAVVAGLIAGALLAPSARIAKLYHFISPVPHWAERYLQPGALAIGAVRLALALPLAVVLYGIVPMAEFWDLSPAVAAAAGPALVAATALAAVFAVRPLAGAHLGSGLLEWHLLRHDTMGVVGAGGGSGGAAANSAVAAAKEAVMRKRLHSVYATICQVGLQLLAPAAMLVCLALLYGAASGSLDSFRPPEPLIANLGSKPLVLPAFKTPNPVAPPPPAAAGAASAAAEGFLEGMEGLAGAEDVAAAAAPVTEAAGAAVGADPGGGAASAGSDLPPLPPLDFVAFAAGFLSWWSCLVLCLFTYPLLFVYRTGLHVG